MMNVSDDWRSKVKKIVKRYGFKYYLGFADERRPYKSSPFGFDGMVILKIVRNDTYRGLYKRGRGY